MKVAKCIVWVALVATIVAGSRSLQLRLSNPQPATPQETADCYANSSNLVTCVTNHPITNER